MGILNYTTSINSIKTIGEITTSLVSSGANKIIVDYEVFLPYAIMDSGNTLYKEISNIKLLEQ